MKSSNRSAVIVGIVCSVLGVIASTQLRVISLEESLGLGVLYSLRGPVEPSPGVIIVAISSESATTLGLADQLQDERDLTGWPRLHHVDLVNQLDAAEVGAIVFDIHFRRSFDTLSDEVFAAAIENSGSVILLEELDRDITLPAQDSSALQYSMLKDSPIPPIPMLANAALTSVPFTLPGTPDPTNQYWAFVSTANDSPTLPVAAYSVYARDAHARIVEQLKAARPELVRELDAPDLGHVMASVRRAVQREPDLLSALGGEAGPSAGEEDTERRHLQTLVDLYTGLDSRYLNYYGPPQTITTVPVDEILLQGVNPELPWAGSIVFVGFSDRSQPDQEDYFLSFYSQRDGSNLSGVEIAATALANLIDGSALKPLSIIENMVVAVVIGALLGACFCFSSPFVASVSLTALLGGYLAFAELEFAGSSAWWPIATPILIQGPVALLLGFSLRYMAAERRRLAVSRGASQFLPADLVKRLGDEPGRATRASELVDGVCLVTDMERFTAFAESLPPKRLEAALNAYYEELFACVNENGGLVTDIVGDSMVAVWRGPTAPDEENLAPVRAALEIRSRLTDRSTRFPATRIGVNAGEFVLGTVGAEGHLEYRAVGDTVNTAARIQALNKELGTSLLATRTALPAAGIVYRPIGFFQLSGKQAVIELCEPMAVLAEATDRERSLAEQFESALSCFYRHEWGRALDAFRSIQSAWGDDAPTGFYIERIRRHLEGEQPRSDAHVIRFA